MPAIDTSAWPTKDEARYELGGLSLSQLNNLIKAKRLEVRLRKRPNQPPIGVINPVDLAKEKEMRAQIRPHVMPAAGAAGSQELELTRPADLAPTVFDWKKGFAEVIRGGEAVPLAQKPRVTLREAVALGFQAEDLRNRVKAGQLENVGTSHRYRFRRRDLDAL